MIYIVLNRRSATPSNSYTAKIWSFIFFFMLANTKCKVSSLVSTMRGLLKPRRTLINQVGQPALVETGLPDL
jgi:hypothetical protein